MADPVSLALAGSVIAAGVGVGAQAIEAKSQSTPNMPTTPNLPSNPATATSSVASSVPGAQAAAATQGGTLFGTAPGETQANQASAPTKTLLGS